MSFDGKYCDLWVTYYNIAIITLPHLMNTKHTIFLRSPYWSNNIPYSYFNLGHDIFFRFEPINPAELTYDTNHDKRKTRSKSPRTRYSSNKSPGPVSPTSLSAIGKYFSNNTWSVIRNRNPGFGSYVVVPWRKKGLKGKKN